jgi:hypothetical protein
MQKQVLDFLKKIFTVLFVINLVACGGGEDKDDKFLTSEFLNQVLVSSSDSSEIVNSSNRTDLTITGLNNTIEIETDLRNLVISGGNNLLNFSENIDVQSCIVSGSDNSLVTSGNLTIDCNVTGAGNIGF